MGQKFGYGAKSSIAINQKLFLEGNGLHAWVVWSSLALLMATNCLFSANHLLILDRAIADYSTANCPLALHNLLHLCFSLCLCFSLLPLPTSIYTSFSQLSTLFSCNTLISIFHLLFLVMTSLIYLQVSLLFLLYFLSSFPLHLPHIPTPPTPFLHRLFPSHDLKGWWLHHCWFLLTAWPGSRRAFFFPPPPFLFPLFIIFLLQAAPAHKKLH